MKTERILLFTGAGFSKPLGLPTTTEFKEEIDKIFSGRKTNFVHSLRAYLGKSFYDIEKLLSTLELFAQDGNSYLKYLTLTYPFPNNDALKGHFDQTREELLLYQKAARNCINELKASLFNILRKYDRLLAVKQYLNLLSEIYQLPGFEALSIVTTNYDLIFEDCLEGLESAFVDLGITGVDTGFRQKNLRTHWNASVPWEWNRNTIEYKKIHGSLDWHLADGDRIQATGRSERPEDPGSMLLLYPGFKGSPNNEPFQTLHDDLFKRLTSCTTVFAIGFAFRDDYINNLFVNALKMNTSMTVHCFNPLPLTDLPTDSEILNLCRRFPGKFLYHEKGIEPTPKSLDLIGAVNLALF